ncbi:MAG: hypothetical protein HOE90_15260 [Bacteriovoracaceae bacterium]|jgi:hypothetical protein|nr:hypothetical protein [Bacteriovoracaceae bacterium]
MKEFILTIPLFFLLIAATPKENKFEIRPNSFNRLYSHKRISKLLKKKSWCFGILVQGFIHYLCMPETQKNELTNCFSAMITHLPEAQEQFKPFKFEAKILLKDVKTSDTYYQLFPGSCK